MLTFDLTHPRAEELLDEALSAQPERLDLAAFAVAALESPTLEVDRYLARLDALAERVRARRGEPWGAREQLAALHHVLVVEEGFRGNESDYGDPLNSLLDAVMERKVGIPISLSVLWMEVARRAGIALYGVGFPGHFLVGLDDADGRRFVADPFHHGRVLSPDDCSALLRKAVPNALVSEDLFQPAPVRAITWRMLTNLKRLHFAKGDQTRALKVEDLLLRLAPDHPGELRARAALLSSLGAYKAALADVERVLQLGPAPDAPALHAAARALRERLAFVN